MRFLDVKTDYALKRVFGSEGSKPLLVGFLNAMLEYDGERAIVDLTIVDPYQIPMLKGMKDTFVDVKAVLASGKHVIIEMQVLNVAGFEKRILHNAATGHGIDITTEGVTRHARFPRLNPRPQAGEEASESLREICVDEYAPQLQKGQDYKLLNPVIALTFTDFSMFDDSAEYISRFRLVERNRFIEYGDDVELIFVELPKFTLELQNLHSIQDKWIYFIKNAGSLEYIPDNLASVPCINEAFTQINEAAMSREELEIQFKRRDFIIMQRGSLMLAETRGMKKGMEKAREEVARKLLDILDDVTIADKTGLSVDQVRQLRIDTPGRI